MHGYREDRRRGRDARCGHPRPAILRHEAHPTRAVGLHPLVIAQRWYVYPVRVRSLQDRGALRGDNLAAIDPKRHRLSFDLDHAHLQ